jgi:hypothetical protein
MVTTNLGAVGKRVNASKGILTITNTDTGEHLFLQDIRISHTHTEYREPTTSAGVIYYSGQPNNRLQGTVLYSTDQWKLPNTGWAALINRNTSGEVPIVTLAFKATANDGTTDTFTWTSAAKCESITNQHAPEGATKIEFSFVLIGDVTPT